MVELSVPLTTLRKGFRVPFGKRCRRIAAIPRRAKLRYIALNKLHERREHKAYGK